MWMQGPVTAEANAAMTAPVPKATFLQRLCAYIIDTIILSVATGCLGIAGGGVAALAGDDQVRTLWDTGAGIFSAVLPLTYFAWSYSISGETIGKRVMKIRVVSIDGSGLGGRKGIVRALGYIPSGLFLALGFLWPLWDADKQAWHDKMAGTCVVPAVVQPEALQGTIEPAEARSRQRRWLLGLGIPTVVLLAAGLVAIDAIIQKAVAEVTAMEPWPAADIAPEALVNVDLSQLGLAAGEPQDARDDETWSDGGYSKGVLLTYHSPARDVVAIWALQYNDDKAASADYHTFQEWAGEPGTCGRYAYAYAGPYGIVHCQFSDAYMKLFRHGRWIVNIVARQGTQLPPDVLVDAVRDALAAHWKAMAPEQLHQGKLEPGQDAIQRARKPAPMSLELAENRRAVWQVGGKAAAQT